MITQISEGFAFDEVKHRYLVDGRPVRSVTQVLKLGHLSKDYGDIDPKVLANAAARGTAVHTAIERLNEGTLNWDDVHEEILPRVLAYQQFVNDYQWKHLCSERKYYSQIWDYAGGMDEVGLMPVWKGNEGPWLLLLDYKTAYAKEVPGWTIQVQAYKQLWNENNPDRKIEHCAILWLNRDGDYEVIDADDPEAWAMFVYALKILAWKKKHNR